MNRTTLLIVLIVLIVIAAGLWGLYLRGRQYPKEYTGPPPQGPGAPTVMDKPMGMGQPTTTPQRQPSVGLE